MNFNEMENIVGQMSQAIKSYNHQWSELNFEKTKNLNKIKHDIEYTKTLLTTNSPYNLEKLQSVTIEGDTTLIKKEHLEQFLATLQSALPDMCVLYDKKLNLILKLKATYEKDVEERGLGVFYKTALVMVEEFQF